MVQIHQYECRFYLPLSSYPILYHSKNIGNDYQAPLKLSYFQALD